MTVDERKVFGGWANGFYNDPRETDYMRDLALKLLKENEELRKLLEKTQYNWQSISVTNELACRFCPICGNAESYGHAYDCKIKLLLENKQ